MPGIPTAPGMESSLFTHSHLLPPDPLRVHNQNLCHDARSSSLLSDLRWYLLPAFKLSRLNAALINHPARVISFIPEVNGLWGGHVSPWAGPGASSVLQASINLGLSILPITAGGIQSISSTWTTWTPIIHCAPGTPGPQRLWTHHQPAPRSPSGGLSAEAAPPA